ncbi:MAG: hypothetical protein WBM25_11520 [Azonexus sp.]|jgi:hypothetical protein
MEKLTLKSACSIAIAAFGIALPLSAAQAASQDGMGGGTWSSAPQSDASPTIYYDNLRPMPKGAQGPIRSDMASTGEIWSSHQQSDASPTIYYDALRPAPKGPQGPTRMDMTDNQSASNTREDMQKAHVFRFPLSGGG